MTLDGPHPYEEIPLFWAGMVVGVASVALHLYLFLKPRESMALLKKLPRDYTAGVIVTSIAFVWAWLLVAPRGLGPLSALEMNFGEFDKVKPYMRIGIPVALYLFVTQVRELLFCRGLGMLMLMAAAPILEAAFLKEPTTRLLLPIYAYVLLTLGMFWVGMPFTLRDQINWATRSLGRFKMLALAGLGYAALIVICALAFWR